MKNLSFSLYLLIIFCSNLLTSCANLNDTRKDLGDDYTYSTDSKWRKISPNWEYYNTAIYSKVTNYNFNDSYIIALQKPDFEQHKIIIGEELESKYMTYCSYLKDSTSEEMQGIKEVVKQDSTLYKLLKAKHVTDQNSIKDKQIIEVILDSIFHNDPYYVKLFNAKENYWIIDKKHNKRFGPLNNKQFERKCADLKITLKLNN